MEIFDKIGETACKVYKNTTEKVDKFTKETKLKMKMNENKAKIEDLYKEIGSAVYRIHISRKNDNADEEIKISCNEIEKLSREIEEANEELLKIKNKKQCKNCYEEIDATAKYCPKCGMEQEDIEQQNNPKEDVESTVEDKTDIEQDNTTNDNGGETETSSSEEN